MGLQSIVRRLRLGLCAALAALVVVHSAAVFAASLRVVTYNIEADIGGYTTARPGLTTVLQAIGNETVNGLARPIDVLALQETTSNTTTVAPLVTAMNSIYGAGTYAMSPYQATQNGGAGSGNGPNALIYNAMTLQLVASVGIGTPSTSSAPRQPVRYEFRPAGGTVSNDFYVYVSHCKSGTTSNDLNRRNIEAQLLRADEATLSASASVVYVGDFNLGSSSEAAYQTLLAVGQGQGFDPLNQPGVWEYNSAFRGIMTCSCTNLRYRDDFQIVTQNVLNGTGSLKYVAGSYHAFGNNGSVAVNGSVGSPSNTALPGLANRSAVLSALTTASDHLPVVADYTVGVNPPTIGQQPAGQNVCPGATATFVVTASGQGTLSYQWQKDGVDLVNGGHYSGATAATLTISNADAGDATDYRCVVSDSGGSTNSNQTALTLKTATAITQQPVAEEVCAGGTVTFRVVATGDGTLSYQWTKDGNNLSNGGHYAGATTASLIVSNTDAADAANYQCIVNAGCGTATSNSVTLALKAVTTITQPPVAQSVCPGGTAAFSVDATGDSTLSYQWQKNGTNLSNTGHYSGVTTASLAVSDADASDVAGYDCVVTAGCGSVTSSQAALTLNAATTITQEPQAQTVDTGGVATFSVVATGDGMLTYWWQKDGVYLSDGGHYSGVTTAVLDVANASGSEAGNYRCIVTADCGPIVSSAAVLSVNPPPPHVAADFDADGDVDLEDFAYLRACFNGPNRPSAGAPCDECDLDQDSDVDLEDFSMFRACFNGPNRPPACL